jgi:hypothetical protein
MGAPNEAILAARLTAARHSVAAAETELARLFEELKGTARAEKMVSLPLEQALAELRAAQAVLAEIERLLTADAT